MREHVDTPYHKDLDNFGKEPVVNTAGTFLNRFFFFFKKKWNTVFFFVWLRVLLTPDGFVSASAVQLWVGKNEPFYQGNDA